jgi:16S rRNA (adenine1518-N6/adenine1519-N6)-dimethyltransferase
LTEEYLEPINVPALLRKFGLRPSKGLGQNFLVDSSALLRVVKAADISPDDLILEVGPGLGSLTRLLAAEANRVFAVEIDGKLLPALHETLLPFQNVEVVVGDILNINPKMIFAEAGLFGDRKVRSYKVVANIPYYITSALIRHLLESEIQPSCMVLTVQKEVAQRICGHPPNMSLLALSVQVYGEPKITAKIPAGAFYPVPKVDSSIVKIELYPKPVIHSALIPEFFRLAKAGFNQKRKTLRNSLSAGLQCSRDQAETILMNAGIDPQRRAQTLSLTEWEALTVSTTDPV